MKILICDDDKNILNVIKGKLEAVLKERAEEEINVIYTFDNAFKLLEYMEKNRINVDAVIMDINISEDGKTSGIDVAKILKDEYPGINIIFCTGNIQYAQDVFEAEPLYMLLKPVDDDKLRDAVDKLYTRLKKKREKFVTIKSAKSIYQIPVYDIKYIESQGRYVKVYTEDNIISSINRLERLLEVLGESFIQCHKSYLVNINKIKKFEYSKLTLFDDTEIAISRKFRNDVKEALLNSI